MTKLTFPVATRFSPTFHGVWSDHQSRDGQTFEVLETLLIDDQDTEDGMLPMYRIRFPDGVVIEAFPEEVDADVTFEEGGR